MAIPRNISQEHVLRAIEEIEKNGVPENRKPRTQLLVYNGRVYPPKYVITLANKYANGKPLNHSKFTTQEAVRYLRRLGFQIARITAEEIRESTDKVETEIPSQSSLIELPANLEEYPPDEFDRKMYTVFGKFASLVEERLKAIIEKRSELEEIYQESEDTIRYMMFYALTTVGRVDPLDVYLEYLHPEVPNKKYAKLDTFVSPKEDRPALAFEMKFQKKIGNNAVPKPDNAGAVFADILKLALFRKEQGNIERYFVYVADEHMINYLSNSAHGYEPFISLEENTEFKVTREYLIRKPPTFIRQLKKITEKEDFPEPTVICRFRRDPKFGNKEMAIRIYKVVP
ncbi:DUF7662 domain-containing protein [Thermococcus sp.]